MAATRTTLGATLPTGSQQASLRKSNKMTPTTDNGSRFGTDVTRTVFDLTSFDDVKLKKPFPLPEKPATVAEALALVGNDEAQLLDLIYKGVVSKARDAAYASDQGWVTVEEPSEAYNGRFADEETGKKIDAAILALAKVNGYSKDLDKAKKEAIKAEVTGFLRANPGMLKGIMGSVPAATAPTTTTE